MQLYINSSCSPKDALKHSTSKPLLSVSVPDLYAGDVIPYEITLMDSTGSVISTSGKFIQLGIGSNRKGPNGGTFDVSISDTVVSFNYDDEAATISNELSSIGFGNFYVHGRDGTYGIRPASSLSASIDVDVSNLQPKCYATIIENSGSYDLTIKPKLYAYQEGSSGFLSLKTAEMQQACGQQSVPALLQVEVDGIVVLSKEVTVRNELINDYIGDFDPVQLPTYVSQGQLDVVSASLATLATLATTIDSKVSTSSFNAFTSSYQATSASFATRIDASVPTMPNSTITMIADSSGSLKGYGLTSLPASWQIGNTDLTALSIGYGVTTIGEDAVNGCQNLTGIIVIPNSVTNIGNYAFGSCNSISSITIPNSVTNIGTGAFNNCTSLSSITIPNSVTNIEGYMFENCTSLSSINIPNSVTTMGDYVFNNCTSLSSINYRSPLTSVGTISFVDSFITTIHVLSSDSSWTAGSGQTIGGKSGITVVKDL